MEDPHNDDPVQIRLIIDDEWPNYRTPQIHRKVIAGDSKMGKSAEQITPLIELLCELTCRLKTGIQYPNDNSFEIPFCKTGKSDGMTHGLLPHNLALFGNQRFRHRFQIHGSDSPTLKLFDPFQDLPLQAGLFSRRSFPFTECGNRIGDEFARCGILAAAHLIRNEFPDLRGQR
jgi:hypothetical protein